MKPSDYIIAIKYLRSSETFFILSLPKAGDVESLCRSVALLLSHDQKRSVNPCKILLAELLHCMEQVK